MSEVQQYDPSRSKEEQEAVTARLKSTGGTWITMPPSYDVFSRAELSKKLGQVRETILSETNADPIEIEEAYVQSQEFIESSFDFFESKKGLGGDIGRAFVVPMRSDRQEDDYATESIPFYPLLDPKRFGVTSEIRMRTMYGIPPTILDTYSQSDNPNERGALVLAPLYSDMHRDIWYDDSNVEQAIRLDVVIKKILKETVEFAHGKLGANYIGLGATLPAPVLTDFGRKLRAIEGMENLVTTTGHGGTVHMLGQTVLAAMDRPSVESNGRIGVLGGAGSIGWSSIQLLKNILPDHDIHAFDKREERMHKLKDSSTDMGKVAIVGSVAHILMKNKVIVSAITEKIDLDDAAYRDIDLNGVVWVDDSQPGSVDREQLEARGGKVVWVAGKDTSESSFMTRDGYYTNGIGYNYGESSGLYGPTTEFACGLEAAVVAASQAPENAVVKPVAYEDAVRIGKLFDEYGVKITDFQSFGKPVDIE